MVYYMTNNDKNKITINEIEISYDQPCYIIAEIGINHNGDIEIAKKIIDHYMLYILFLDCKPTRFYI